MQGPVLQTLHGSCLVWGLQLLFTRVEGAVEAGEVSKAPLPPWPLLPRTSHGGGTVGLCVSSGALDGWRTFHVSADATPPFILISQPVCWRAM